MATIDQTLDKVGLGKLPKPRDFIMTPEELRISLRQTLGLPTSLAELQADLGLPRSPEEAVQRLGIPKPNELIPKGGAF